MFTADISAVMDPKSVEYTIAPTPMTKMENNCIKEITSVTARVQSA
jgi:hypothetical protein